MPENINLINRDTFFHASISNNLINFGRLSTGMDGLFRTYYHFGSHFLFGGLSNHLNVGSLTFYSLYAPIIFFPLFLVSLVELLLRVTKHFSPKKVELKDFFFLGAPFIFLSFYCFSSKNFPGALNLELLSDSFLVSLLILISVLLLLLKRPNSVSLVVLLILMNLICLCTKISTGINTSLALSTFIFFGMEEKWTLVKKIFFFIFILASVFSVLVFNSFSRTAPFHEWFYFYKTFIKPGYLWHEIFYTYSFLIFTLFSILYWFLNAVKKDAQRFWFYLFVVGAIIGNELSLIVINIAAGAGYYFTHISKILAVVFCFYFLIQSGILRKKEWLALILANFLIFLAASKIRSKNHATLKRRALSAAVCDDNCKQTQKGLELLKRSSINNFLIDKKHPYWSFFRNCVQTGLAAPAYTQKIFWNNAGKCNSPYYSFEHLIDRREKTVSELCNLNKFKKIGVLKPDSTIKLFDCTKNKQ